MTANALMKERRQMRNPAYCGLLAWQMACGYEADRTPMAFMPIGMVFVGVPLMLDGRVRATAERTQERSGIDGFAGKLAANAPDLRGGLLPQMLRSRSLCSESLAFACRYGLLSIQAGKVIALRTGDIAAAELRILGRTIAGDARAARKLGAWFAQVGPREIELLFNMEF